jgi:hypothetical protein
MFKIQLEATLFALCQKGQQPKFFRCVLSTHQTVLTAYEHVHKVTGMDKKQPDVVSWPTCASTDIMASTCVDRQ